MFRRINLKKALCTPVLSLTMAMAAFTSSIIDARPATYQNAQESVYAIGDLHGDFSAMVKILRAAKLINSQNRWIGGSATLVQVGDQLDRGNTEKEILDLFESLIVQAEQAGGQVVVLNGNHETMNVALDFRYITSGGFKQFEHYYTGQTDSVVTRLPTSQRGRAVAFKPGGPYAKILGEHNSIVQIGQTVYVHGGLTSSHVDYGLDRMNSEISAWMHGNRSTPSMIGSSGPLWNRDYGSTVSSSACSALNTALAKLNARRLVIAHTTQSRINQACNGMVWRIDVGMASYYNGRLQALKITNDDLIQIVEESGRLTETGFGDANGGGSGGNCITPNTPATPSASEITATSYRASWGAVSGADKYIVQVWRSSAWQEYTTTTNTAVNITGETSEKAYSRVIAVNSCGTQGAASEWVTVTMGSNGGGSCATPSKAATPTASNVTASSYTLAWAGVSGATSYLVQRWNSTSSAWQDVATTSNKSYSITGEAGDKAFARIVAINACGTKGAASDWVTVELNNSNPGPGDGSGGGSETCDNGYTEFSGVTDSNGTAKLLSSSYYYSASSATHSIKNIGNSIDMRIYKWDGSAWQLKRASTSHTTYAGSAGYYYPYLVGAANQAYKVCLLDQ